jgi:hypothetical protein
MAECLIEIGSIELSVAQVQSAGVLLHILHQVFHSVQAGNLARVSNLKRTDIHTYDAAAHKFGKKPGRSSIPLTYAQDNTILGHAERIEESDYAILKHVGERLHCKDRGLGRTWIKPISFINGLEFLCPEHHERSIGPI